MNWKLYNIVLYTDADLKTSIVKKLNNLNIYKNNCVIIQIEHTVSMYIITSNTIDVIGELLEEYSFLINDVSLSILSTNFTQDINKSIRKVINTYQELIDPYLPCIVASDGNRTFSDKKSQIEIFQTQLNEAIEAENYELCDMLQKKINELKNN